MSLILAINRGRSAADRLLAHLNARQNSLHVPAPPVGLMEIGSPPDAHRLPGDRNTHRVRKKSLSAVDATTHADCLDV